MNDPYEKCPILETNHFILRIVEKNDVKNLLECYSDIKAQKYFNADNFLNDFKYKTLDEMNKCIDFWLSAYKNKLFVRFSIVDKSHGKAIGTIEIFGGEFGVLRIDINSKYEKNECLKEIIEICVNNFFTLFNTNRIITKAIPDAVDRVKALVDNGFLEYTKEMKPLKDNYLYKDK